jgi:hypothetical protein
MLTQRSDETIICNGNLKKNNNNISLISVAKPNNFVVVAFTCVLKSPALFYVDSLHEFI